MSSDLSSSSVGSAGFYAVGDRVCMKQSLSAASSDELPAQHFCNRGEVLIVRRVTDEKRNMAFPVYVSHEHITDRSFGVTLDEIESV